MLCPPARFLSLISAVLVCLGTASTYAVDIYVENFNGGATPLAGTQPGTSLMGTYWGASPNWTADGTKTSTSPSNAFLPFYPKAGNVYTLSADLNPTSAPNNAADWFALGFSRGADYGSAWQAATNDPFGWALNRFDDTSPTTIQTFLGVGTGGGAGHDLNPDVAGPVNIQMVLDTTAANWTVEYFANGNSIRGPVAFGNAGNPGINYIGVGGYNSAMGTVDNLSLTAQFSDIQAKEGTVLLQDNFTVNPPGTPDTSDVNFNLAARQAGSSLGTVNYTKLNSVNNSQVGNAISDKTVIANGNALLVANGGGVELAQNFNGSLSQGGLAMSFDVAPEVQQGAGSPNWVSFNFGYDPGTVPATFAINNPADHFGILFRENGDFQAFDGNAVVGAGTFTTTPSEDTLYTDFEIVMTDSLDGNPFDGIGDTEFEVFYQGNSIFSYTKAGGFDNNFISIQANGVGYVDNLSIRNLAPVPEPATFAVWCLLGLGMLGVRRWRRANR